MKERGDDFQLIDVRESYEREICEIGGDADMGHFARNHSKVIVRYGIPCENKSAVFCDSPDGTTYFSRGERAECLREKDDLGSLFFPLSARLGHNDTARYPELVCIRKSRCIKYNIDLTIDNDAVHVSDFFRYKPDGVHPLDSFIPIRGFRVKADTRIFFIRGFYRMRLKA